MNKSSNFKYYIPVDEIVKGIDKKGEEVYKVRGIITDDSKDFDGESLTQSGLDFSKFNFINWNHGKDPSDLIGEPEDVKYIPGKGHMMEGYIYPDSEKGQSAVKLMQTLKKSKKKNRLGFSIEGSVLERDLVDPNKVKKAEITAVALCPFPKNGNTWAELIEKGFSSNSVQKEEDLFYEEINGGQEYIIDILLDDGDRVKINKGGDLFIEKCQTTDNSRALIKEDVEGNTKIQKSKLYKKIEIEYRDGGGKLEELLDYIKKIGNIGHSFSIIVDLGDSEYEKKFYWDGDGADSIKSIKVSEIKEEDLLKKSIITIVQGHQNKFITDDKLIEIKNKIL